MIDKIVRLADTSSSIDATFRLEVFVLRSGYVLKYTEGTNVFNSSFQPSMEAFETREKLIKKLNSILDEKK